MSHARARLLHGDGSSRTVTWPITHARVSGAARGRIELLETACISIAQNMIMT
jgi:hypothetical protein